MATEASTRVNRELGNMGIQEFVNKKLVRFGMIDAPATIEAAPTLVGGTGQVFVNVAVLKQTQLHERRVARGPSVAQTLRARDTARTAAVRGLGSAAA